MFTLKTLKTILLVYNIIHKAEMTDLVSWNIF